MAAGETWGVRSHSVLLGHEDWVHSVAWCPRCLPSHSVSANKHGLKGSTAEKIWDIREKTGSAVSESWTDASTLPSQPAAREEVSSGVAKINLKTPTAQVTSTVPQDVCKAMGSQEQDRCGAVRDCGDCIASPVLGSGDANMVQYSEEPGLLLMSASMDRTMMLWEQEPAGQVWMCTKTVGDAGASLLL